MEKADKIFHNQFITAQEIADRVGVSRAAVTYKMQQGYFPKPVENIGVTMWLRTEGMEDLIANWESK